MAHLSGLSYETTEAARRSPQIPNRPVSTFCLRLGAVGLVLASSLSVAARAEHPTTLDAEERRRAWHSTFTARFTALVAPQLRVDGDFAARVSRVWDGMVARFRDAGSANASPLEQYPLLSFVDDRFMVMKTRDGQGRETFVVRADDNGGRVPTLSSTLLLYLDEVIYPSLRAIAEEERRRIAEHPEYEPDLDQLAAQNPYLHRLPIRVPAMGPFVNRVIAFSGPAGPLSAADSAHFDRVKWSVGPGRVAAMGRPHPWGIAVELAELVERGQVVCRYRLTRAVVAMDDTFVGEGKRGVLLRQPRLGSVHEVEGCLDSCDDAAAWKPIYPEVAKPRHQLAPVGRRGVGFQPLVPAIGVDRRPNDPP